MGKKSSVLSALSGGKGRLVSGDRACLLHFKSLCTNKAGVGGKSTNKPWEQRVRPPIKCRYLSLLAQSPTLYTAP